MAGKIQPKKAETAKKDVEKISMETLNIIRTHVFDNGNIAFDATINGMTFYNLNCVWTEKNDGYYFISEPSRKVGDKYYKWYYLNLNDESQQKLVDAVVKASE